MLRNPKIGDVLFLCSPGASAHMIIRYQKMKRPKIPRQAFRFTHVGLVVDHDCVIHSIPEQGRFSKKILGNHSRARMHGVTLDLINDSSFVDGTSTDFIALRCIKLENSEKDRKILDSIALRYFGLGYNFRFDYKTRFNGRRYRKPDLYCSELVDEILNRADLTVSTVSSSEVLPVDLYCQLIDSNEWFDVSGEYSEKLIDTNSQVAEHRFKLAQILLSSRETLLDSSLKSKKILEELNSFVDSLLDNPSKAIEAKEYLENVEDDAQADLLLGCFRSFTRRSRHFESMHVLEDETLSVQKELDELGRHVFKRYFEIYLTSVCRTLQYAMSVIDLVESSSAPDQQRKELCEHLLNRMNEYSNSIPSDFEQIEYDRRVFHRLVQFLILRGVQESRIVWAFVTLANGAWIAKQAERYFDVCRFEDSSLALRRYIKPLKELEILPKILTACYVDYSTFEEPDGTLRVDFEELLA